MSNNADVMAQQAYKARQNAYAPYSDFSVGCSVMAEDGAIFTGCNVENSSYGITICAEQSAITSLISNGKKKIKAIAIIGSGKGLCAPCGKCRQVIREFATPDAPIHLCDAKTGEVIKTTNIKELLPISFGPENLNITGENHA